MSLKNLLPSEEGSSIDQNVKIRKNSFKKMIQNRSNILLSQSINKIAVEEALKKQKLVIFEYERTTFLLSVSISA